MNLAAETLAILKSEAKDHGPFVHLTKELEALCQALDRRLAKLQTTILPAGSAHGIPGRITARPRGKGNNHE